MKKVINFFKEYWGTCLIYVFLVVGYVLMTTNDLVDGFLFPKPEKILKAFGKYPEVLLKGMLSSFTLLFPGLLMGTLLALLIGIPLGMHKKVRKQLHPVIYSFSVIPAILLSPFALHLAPSFRAASMFLVVYSSLWATLFATINGIMTIDSRYLDNAATLNLTGAKKLFHVVLPAAMPSITSGFITSVRSAFLILVFAEMYGSKYGMGYFVQNNADLGRFQNVWCGFIFMVIVLVTLMQIIEQIKNRMLKWTIQSK